MSIVTRAYTLYQEKGFLAFFKAFLKYFVDFPGVWRRLRLSYYRRRGRCIVSVGNIRITMQVTDDDDAVELLYARTTERYLIKEIINELKPGDTFWDIGANLGIYSLIAAGVPGVNVIAFEPNPNTAKKLKNNITLNHKTSIRVLQTALADTETTVKFATMENRGHGKAHIAFDDDSNTIEVKTDSGDKLTATGAVPRPDIVKIDVEGAECLVLKGMQSILSGCRVIFCEVHPNIQRYGHSPAELESILKSTGFSLMKIQQRDNTYHLKASKI